MKKYVVNKDLQTGGGKRLKKKIKSCYNPKFAALNFEIVKLQAELEKTWKNYKMGYEKLSEVVQLLIEMDKLQK